MHAAEALRILQTEAARIPCMNKEILLNKKNRQIALLPVYGIRLQDLEWALFNVFSYIPMVIRAASSSAIMSYLCSVNYPGNENDFT